MSFLNKGRSQKKALTTGKIFKQLKTTHQRYADVFKALEYAVDLSQPTFPKQKAIPKKLQFFMANKEYKNIGIAPFAAYDGKMYPLDKMEVVIDTLSKNYNIILFGGGNKEAKILNKFETKYSNVNSTAEKLSLAEELLLISHLDVMLSMDSSNGHLAAMLGKKVISLWGVTHPFAGFMPFNQPTDYAITANREKYPLLPTSVYGNTYSKDYKNAAGSISVEKIVTKIKSVIS